MAYISTADFLDVYGATLPVNITNRTDDPDTDDLMQDPQIMRAVAAANDDAEGYVRRQYDSPLKRVPDNLKLHTCALAYAYLCAMIPGKFGQADVDAEARTRAWFDRVATGEVDLEFRSAREEAIANPALAFEQPLPANGVTQQAWFPNY